MLEILEILKYTLPALIVFITAWFIIKQMIGNDQKRRNFEIITKNQQHITPVRLQAYERMALLLERMSPESLIMRISNQSMSAKQLQTELLNTLRAEFDHNVSQQIYISPQAWELIKNAKSTVTQLINNAASRVKPDSNALVLSKIILEDLMAQDKSPVAYALDFLKKEIRQLF